MRKEALPCLKDKGAGSVPVNDNERLIRLPDVLRMIPVSRSAFYDGIRRGIYPAPRPLGRRSVGWPLSEILAIVRNGTRT